MNGIPFEDYTDAAQPIWLANGLGFLAGTIVGYYILRRALRPDGAS